MATRYKRHGPWKIKKRVLKYENRWISVTEDQVIRPDGKDGIFGTVRMNDGVSVLPLDERGFVYLTDEFHYALGRRGLEVVSGAIDGKEKPLTAAKRELREELGIEAKQWLDLGTLNPFTTVVKSSARLYLAQKLRFRKAHQEGSERIRVRKMPLAQAVQFVMQSKITHGQSCVLILKAARKLETEA